MVGDWAAVAVAAECFTESFCFSSLFPSNSVCEETKEKKNVENRPLPKKNLRKRNQKPAFIITFQIVKVVKTSRTVVQQRATTKV